MPYPSRAGNCLQPAPALSIIAMAGDHIRMARGSQLMIHGPSGFGGGGADDMRKTAEMLDRLKTSMAAIYANRTGMPLGEIETLLDAETWLSATEALEMGFVDEIDEVPERRPEWSEHEFHHDLRLQIGERLVYVETRLLMQRDIADSTISVVNIHDA